MAPNGLRWQFTVAPFGLNVSPEAMLTVVQYSNCFLGIMVLAVVWATYW